MLHTARFLSLCLGLSKQASVIVKEVLESGNLGIREKSINDHVTLADTNIQAMLLSNFKAYFPQVLPKQLTIIGEEPPVVRPER